MLSFVSFFYFIKYQVLKFRKTNIVCYGASALGKMFYTNNQQKFNVVAFVDGDRTKQGSYFCGVPVLSLADLERVNFDCVVITSQYIDQIKPALINSRLNFKTYLDFEPQISWLERIKFLSLTICYHFIKFIGGVYKRENTNLHIITNGVFSESFTGLINNCFNDGRHQIITCANSETEYLHRAVKKGYKKQLFFKSGAWSLASIKHNIIYYYYLTQAKKVYIHGFFPHMSFPYLIDKSLCKKSVWVGWGRDVYKSYSKLPYINRKLKCAKANIEKFVYFDKADREYVCQHYNANLVSYSGFYPNPLDPSLLTSSFLHSDKFNVMVGNSASRELHHIKIFEALKRVERPFSFVVPLAYGDIQYKKEILAYGNQSLSNFYPVTKFMSPEIYCQFLSGINVAIFHSNQQIALSTIYALLYNQTTVYLSSRNTGVWNKLTGELGLVIRDSELLFQSDNLDLLILNTVEQENNRLIASQFFNLHGIAEQWQTIFENV